jgi:hypothetical protein
MTKPQTTFALFKGTEQISKAHSTRDAVFIEAFARGIMIHQDCVKILPSGYAVKEVKS